MIRPDILKPSISDLQEMQAFSELVNRIPGLKRDLEKRGSPIALGAEMASPTELQLKLAELAFEAGERSKLIGNEKKIPDAEVLDENGIALFDTLGRYHANGNIRRHELPLVADFMREIFLATNMRDDTRRQAGYSERRTIASRLGMEDYSMSEITAQCGQIIGDMLHDSSIKPPRDRNREEVCFSVMQKRRRNVIIKGVRGLLLQEYRQVMGSNQSSSAEIGRLMNGFCLMQNFVLGNDLNPSRTQVFTSQDFLLQAKPAIEILYDTSDLSARYQLL